MGNLQSIKKDDISSNTKSLDAATAKVVQSTDDVTQANRAVSEIAEKIKAAVGPGGNVGAALASNAEYVRAKLDVDVANAKAYRALVAQKQAMATNAALLKLENRTNTLNQYTCPDFKACVGDSAYNKTRSYGIANDYNRTLARKDGRMLTKYDSISDGGNNACTMDTTFLNTADRTYANKKTTFKYECDAGRGWTMRSANDIESMLSASAY